METAYTSMIALTFLILAAAQICNGQDNTWNRTTTRTQNCSQLQTPVREFNETKDWEQLKRSLGTALNYSSTTYIQLQRVNKNYPMWRIGNRGYTMLASLLLCAGLPVDTPDENGETMLHGAVTYGNLQMVKLLLNHGANVNVRDSNGWTPLMAAAEDGNLEVARRLVRAGANTSLKDNNGGTALSCAWSSGHVTVARYLETLSH